MPNLLTELKRRNVFRVAVLYAIVAWLVLQIADLLTPLADDTRRMHRAYLAQASN